MISAWVCREPELAPKLSHFSLQVLNTSLLTCMWGRQVCKFCKKELQKWLLNDWYSHSELDLTPCNRPQRGTSWFHSPRRGRGVGQPSQTLGNDPLTQKIVHFCLRLSRNLAAKPTSSFVVFCLLRANAGFASCWTEGQWGEPKDCRTAVLVNLEIPLL